MMSVLMCIKLVHEALPLPIYLCGTHVNLSGWGRRFLVCRATLILLITLGRSGTREATQTVAHGDARARNCAILARTWRNCMTSILGHLNVNCAGYADKTKSVVFASRSGLYHVAEYFPIIFEFFATAWAPSHQEQVCCCQ
jgi:hypothetical protein